MIDTPPQHGWTGRAPGRSEARPQGTDPIVCSFCGRPQDEHRRVVAGPTRAVAICEACVDLCREIFAESQPEPER